MALAYRWSLNAPPAISWPYAEARHAAIGRGGDHAVRVLPEGEKRKRKDR